jgi:integrase
MYTEARIAAKVQLEPPAGRRSSTFHQVRSLASKLALDAGYELKVVQHAMAHENENTTKVYQDEHELPHDQVAIVFTKELLGGDFK